MGTWMSAEQRKNKKLKKEAEDIPHSRMELKRLSTTESFLRITHTTLVPSQALILSCPKLTTSPPCLHAAPFPHTSGHNAHLVSRLSHGILLPPDASSSQKVASTAVRGLPSLFCPSPRCFCSFWAPRISTSPSTSCPLAQFSIQTLPFILGKASSSSRKPSWSARGILPAVCTAPWRPPKPPGSLDSPPLAGPPGSAGSTAAGPPHLPTGQGERV